MYPFDFKPSNLWINNELIFVAMPFNKKYNPVYYNLIEPSLYEVNKDFEIYRSDFKKVTNVIWNDILENLYSAKLTIGVLTGHNPNVYYELGIAHATQQIQRQLLLAPHKRFRSKFDVQHFSYTPYDPEQPENSIENLVNDIKNQLAEFDESKVKLLENAVMTLSTYENLFLQTMGSFSSHFNITDLQGKLTDIMLVHIAFNELIKKKFLRYSYNGQKKESSYYWTELGNTILFQKHIIDYDTKENRNKVYRKYVRNGDFFVPRKDN